MFKLHRLSPAMVVALIALFFAVGGVGYAQKAIHLVISGSQIKKGSIALNRLSRSAQSALKGQKGDPGIQGIQGIPGGKGDPGVQGVRGDKGDQGVPGPTASGYAQNQNMGASTTSGVDVVAVALSGSGGSGPVVVPFDARLHVQGVVSVLMTGAAATDGDWLETSCRPQVAAVGGAFSDVGPTATVRVNGDSHFGGEHGSVAVVGELDVTPGTYDARIVCGEGFGAVSTTAIANSLDGDAISAIAVAS
jgi:hypothetical protein